MIIVTVSVTITTRSRVGLLVMITNMGFTSCLGSSGTRMGVRYRTHCLSGDMA